MRQLSQPIVSVAMPQQPGSTFHSRMQCPHRNLRSPQKLSPRLQQQISQPRIQQPSFRHSRQLSKKVFQPTQTLHIQPSAALTIKRSLQQRLRSRIHGAALHRTPPEDSNPHLKIRSLLKQHMLLGREEPKYITAFNLIPPVSNEIAADTLGNKVQLQFHMMMPAVGRRSIGILPNASIHFRRQFQSLQHDKIR